MRLAKEHYYNPAGSTSRLAKEKYIDPAGSDIRIATEEFVDEWNIAHPPTYKSMILAVPSLASYWVCDEAVSGPAVDSGPGGHNGTPVGTITQNVADAPAGIDTSKCIEVNDGELTIGDVYDFTGVAPYTIEVWFKRLGASEGGFGRLVAKEDASRSNGWSFGSDESGSPPGAFLQRDIGGAQTTAAGGGGGSAIPIGSWEHLAGVFDGSGQIVYIDGSAGSLTTGAGGNLPNIADVLRIGRQAPGARYVNGRICHVAIYNAALTQAVLLDHYNKGIS